MVIKEINFESANGSSRIRGWLMEPDSPPVGLVQIVHGLGCHSGRYDNMARRLCRAGFVVCADDHAGHGKTAAADDTFGYPGDKGWQTFVEDEHRLRQIVAGEYPDLPFFMFGHSMGSMICRIYAARYPDDGLQALALCGICQQNAGADALLRSTGMEALLTEGKGRDLKEGARYGAVLMAAANDRFPGESDQAWISRDEGVLRDYLADPLNNHVGNSLQMIYDFAQLYRHSTDPRNDAAISAGLPLLLMAGDQDPCGNYGEGVYHAANTLVMTGHRVRTLVYSGYRHEVHNHPDLREKIAEELISFFRSAL